MEFIKKNTEQINNDKAIKLAKEQGKGAIALHGKMIDAPIVARAERTIEMAKALSEGKFFLEPLELAKDKLPCEYCDYRSICGKNEE